MWEGEGEGASTRVMHWRAPCCWAGDRLSSIIYCSVSSTRAAQLPTTPSGFDREGAAAHADVADHRVQLSLPKLWMLVAINAASFV